MLLRIEGTGSTYQEALDNAISNAVAKSKTSDVLINWTSCGVYGKSGSIAGINEVTVEIKYTES